MPATNRKNTPRLRDGVMKRGATWSYVIRVRDTETGISKPRWVGGFPTEEDAKAARDDARVKARHGEYIDRNRITVAAYLDDWLDAHAMEIKPRTLADYRACIRLYAVPRIGHLPIQAVRPSTITRLYRDLLSSGGRDGQPLAVATVTHLHAVLRKAFRDAVIVDELIGSNPVDRAKRPRVQVQEPGTVWTVAQLRAFLDMARQHRLFAFFHVAAYTGARRGELLNLRWHDIDLDGKKITITGSTAVIGGERVNGTTKSGRTRVVSIDDETVAVLRQRKADQAAEQLKAGDSWRGTKAGYVFTTGWGEPIYPDTVTSLMTKLIRADKQLPHARLHDLQAPARDDLAALRRPGSRRRGPAGSRRPGHHPARVRPRHPGRGGCRSGHLRPGRQDRVLANPLAREQIDLEQRSEIFLLAGSRLSESNR